MKNSTYRDFKLLRKCDVDYTIRGKVQGLIISTICKYYKILVGTFLGTTNGSEQRFENKEIMFRTGDTRFEHNTELTQTIRHGFMLYIVVALLTVPAGISATQHQRMEYAPPLVARGLAPEELYKEIEPLPFGMAVSEVKRAIARADREAALAALPPFYLPILKAAQEHQVDAALIRAVIMAESSNNPRAVSHRGARGLMQLMPSTARWLGVADSFDPELNIDGGVRYLKRLLQRFDGNVKLALAAYNAGSRYVRKYGGVPPFRATRLYIKKVLKYQRKYQSETAGYASSLTAV